MNISEKKRFEKFKNLENNLKILYRLKSVPDYRTFYDLYSHMYGCVPLEIKQYDI